MDFIKEKYELKDIDGCQYVSFLSFKGTGINAAFTTRKGGVSRDELSSLNFGLNCGDDAANVEKNTEIISEALGVADRRVIRTRQVHSDIVLSVDKEKAPKQEEISDGLITRDERVVLLGVFADCVPVFIFDKKRGACAIVHSGWKGTVQKIALNALDIFVKEYGCDLEDIAVVIGPAIGGCCFELGPEVIEQFEKEYSFAKEYITPYNEKFKLDLKVLIAHSVFDFGVKYDNISICDLCTMCNLDLFFSHRGEKGKTGRMAGIIFLEGREDD